jgi:hypothetical protein
MRIRLRALGEPGLLFGGNHRHFDPKVALTRHGPFDVRVDEPRRISLGVVAPEEEIAAISAWFQRLQHPLIDSANNALRFPNFPGAQRAMGCRFSIEPEWMRPLPERELKVALQASGADQFERLLSLYSEVIGGLFGDHRPDVVLVGFPEAVAELRVRNPRLSYAEERALRVRQREADSRQLELFDSFGEKEKAAAAEHFPAADELLFRNFHRALKARCMSVQNAVPLQILRRHTYIQAEAKQNDATRAWNLSVALYYKAANVPWQPADLSPGTCFVGISFHHLKRQRGDIIYASLAQAYSTDTEPFALQGETLPDRQVRDKQPYLLASQAEGIIQKVVHQFRRRTGTSPTRVVVHKSTGYQPEEIEGFQSGCGAEVAACDMVWMRPTGFRLIRRGQREVDRGIFAQLEDQKTYLFTTGYVDWWKEYPGPHIPSPLEIGVVGETDVIERSKEILTLTKLNWNSADGLGRTPITLSFARQVGSVMTEVEDGREINPLYRFYM